MNWDIWRIQPSGAGLERITRQNTRIAYPVMLDRRTLVYLATDADGSGPWMYSVDVERRIPHRISSGLESYTSLAASADGARLVATIANTRTSLWRLPLTEDGTAATAAGGPSLVSANGVAPRLGADSLLYVSWRGETTRHMVADARDHPRDLEQCHVAYRWRAGHCTRWAAHRLLG